MRNTDHQYTQVLLQALPVGVCTVDRLGRVLSLNPEGERLLGWSERACAGTMLHELIACTLPHAEAQTPTCPITHALQTGKPAWAAQSTLRCRDGGWRPVEYKCLPFTPHGDLGALFCFRDLSTQLQLEKDLLRLAAIPEESPSPLVEIDAEANLIYANAAMLALMEAHGFNAAGFPAVLPANVADLARRCLGSSESIQGIEVSADDRHFEWNFFPVPQVGLMRGYGLDLTTRKQAERELKRARDAALETARIKSEFLANISHELRTPLNGIIGLTELTLSTELLPDQRDYLGMVRESAANLLSLISSILDFAKIETGTLALQPTTFSLRHTLDDMARPLGLRARQKGLHFQCTVRPEVPDALCGDVNRLRQVLGRLADNAIKFTADGSVCMEVGLASPSPDRPKPDEAQEVLLHFTVTDTGIGIPPDKQRLIFDPFTQADGSSTRQYGGTGLGLAIAGRLVDIMGGRIWVESQGTTTGSRFHFTARFEVSPTDSIPPSPPMLLRKVSVHSLAILLAEDNHINQKFMAHLLKKWGHQVTGATTGHEVLAILGRDQHFDLVLMNIQMPGLDGLQTTAMIRTQERDRQTHLPIIALTAHTLPSDRERCLAAGMDGYLTKPIRAEELYATLAHFLPDEAPDASSATGGAMPSEVYNHAALLTRLEGDTALIHELMTLFLDDIPQRLGQLDQAIRTRAWQTAEHLAHTLRGAASNLCAGRTVDAIHRLETLLHEPEMAHVVDAFAQLEHEVKCLQTVLTSYLTSQPAAQG